MSSLIGGLTGAAVLWATLPLARELLQFFGSAEFFLLSLLGIAAVGIVSAGAVSKGMLTAGLGLCLAMIGVTPVEGILRSTFGVEYLFDGFPIVPVVIGLFAIPEVTDLVVGNTPIARQRLEGMLRAGNKDVMQGMRAALNHKLLIVRSSLIGVFVGAMPGLGPTPAHWIAYASARATEKGAAQSFGTGDVRGVIAPEAANNATDGGNLIPTLIFAIPGSAQMAILLGFLVVLGIQPGPAMLTTHLDLTISLVWIIAIANIIVVPIVLWFSPLLVRFAAIPPKVLAPLLIALVTVSAFQATNQIGDLVVMAFFTVLGLFMKAYGWPRPPILIALVLARPLEKFMWLSVNAYGMEMFARPPFIAILVGIVLVVAFSLRVRNRVEAASATADAAEQSVDEETNNEDISEQVT
jgi:TctA family transporter